jgi:hypothetical protein
MTNYRLSVAEHEGVFDCAISFDQLSVDFGSTELVVSEFSGRGYGSTETDAFANALFELWSKVNVEYQEQLMKGAYNVYL